MARRTGKPIGDLAAQLLSNQWQTYNNDLFMPPGLPITSDALVVSDKKGKRNSRTWDYPAFVNMMAQSETGIEPGDSEGLSFREIRDFSENYEIVRLVIETCKDQLCKLKWSWRIKPNPNLSPKQNRDNSIEDPRVKELNDFFDMPDKEHDFYQWLRLLLDDLLVCDTVSIYNWEQYDGKPYALEVFDVATLERKIDERGRTPRPDLQYPYNIAYQQKIKGLIVASFTSDELLYWIRNPRVNKFYGYGGIEQIITSVNTGIRRALFQLYHYTEGNLPLMFMKAPSTWDKTQISEFQSLWNEMYVALENKAKGMVIPGDADPVFPQKDVLKDDFDEWLARIACYAYSVSPNAFIKNLNRATSEQAREQADEEGLQLRTFIVTNLLNRLKKRHWGPKYDDIEFHMSYDRPQDSKKQAEIDNIYIRVGVKSVDEVRLENGLPSIGAPNRIYTTNGAIPMTEGDKPLMDVFQQKILTDTTTIPANGGDTSNPNG